MKTIYELLRTTRTAQSKKNKAARVQKLIKRRRSRVVKLEQLESRNLMAANFGYVLATDGTWSGGDECKAYGWPAKYYGNCQSSSPVSFVNVGLGNQHSFVNGLTAPDGGKVEGYSSNDGYRAVYPNNGLLTATSAQTNRDFAVQQDVEVAPSSFFPTENIVLNATTRDTTTYQTSVRVATTGAYTFFFTGEASGFSNNSRLSIDGKTLDLGRSGVANEQLFAVERQLTVTLTSGTDYPLTVKWDRNGTGPTFGLDWSGPGLPRQRVTPSTDVVWKHEYSSGATPVTGFITVGSTIDARKRLVDDNYALRYTTTFTVPTTGSYDFFVTTIAPVTASLNSYNDAANLKLGSDVVVSKDKTVASATGQRVLTAGTVVTLEVNYLHRQPFASPVSNLKVEWSGPGFGRSEFKPTANLKYEFFQGSFDQFSDFANRVPTKSFLIHDPKFFALRWNGQTTPLLPVGASAQDVKKALTALTNIGAVGGTVDVTKSNSGEKYSITFGGSVWFRPPLIEDIGTGRVRANPTTKYALTKRDGASTLKLAQNNGNAVAELSNGNTFAISNAPAIIPTRIDGRDLRANVEIPGVAGTFEPMGNPGDANYNNVSNGPNGFELKTKGFEFVTSASYRLMPQKGSNGIERPINLFKIGGLSFEMPAGIAVGLVSEIDFQDRTKLKFVSLGDNTILVSAPFEGGRLTLALSPGSGEPIFSASLTTGIVTRTSNITFMSLELGGMEFRRSEGFNMNYDKAADKFTFTINNMEVATTTPTGKVKWSDSSYLGANYTQSFDMPGVTAAGSTFESAKFIPTGTQTQFQTIAEFEAVPNKVNGALSPDNAFQFRPGLVNDLTSFGTRYKTSFVVPTTGTYLFVLSDSLMQQLKVNDTVLRRDLSPSVYNAPVSMNLIGGAVNSLEYTAVYQNWNARSVSSNSIKITGGGWNNFELGGAVNGSYVASPSFDGVDFNQYRDFSLNFVDNILKAAYAIVDAPITQRRFFVDSELTEAQRTKIKSQIKVTFQGAKLTVTGLPYVMKVATQNVLWEANYGTLVNPVKLTLASGTLSISNGALTPIANIPISSFSIGRTTIDKDGVYQTEYEPLNPSAGGGFKLAYFTRNTYTASGAVDVPGNSFGIYGSDTQLPLDVAGVKLNGLANLGTASSPGLVITNTQFNRLSYTIPDVTVDGLVFKAASVGSAKPLSVNYFPPQGLNKKSYVVLGGAILKAGGTIKSDLKANFGGMGSDGLRIYPAKGTTPASFTFSFGVEETFLAGTQAIRSEEGLNGLKLLYDQKAKAYNFQGNAFLDYNPTRPHTPTDLAFTGTKLAISATVPKGVTGFAANRLDSNTLNFFFGQDSVINGFQFSPQATTNPLRVTVTNNNGATIDTIGGAFSMQLEGGYLYGVMDPTSFTNAVYPATGYVLDFSPRPGQSSGLALVGVKLDGAKKATLTKTLTIKFPVASFDGNVIAQGAEGSEVATLEAIEGKLTKAVIASPTSRVIGDFNFQKFTATYSNTLSGKAWTFLGPATYFGKQVEVGKPAVGNPQLKIGGDPKVGIQLRTISTPFDPLTPDFALPDTMDVAGLTFDTSLLPQDAPVVDQGPAGKVYSLKSQNYGVKLGNTTLSLSLGAKVRVSSSGVSVESFSATGVQNSSFTIGNASLQIKTLTVEYILATKTLQISGDAKFTFKAKAVNVEMNVTLGTKANPGLVIKAGVVESFQVTVNGNFEILKLSIAAEKLTVEYKKENQEFAIYGGIKLSTAPQAGVQIIKDLAVALGSKDKPGIKIVNGSLDALDITINGEINLFKITATPKDLHVSYSAAKNQLQITGELTITLAPKLELTAALPGEGLLVDTSTGKVQIRGLSLAAKGDIKFGAMTIKGLAVEYSEDEAGEVSIAAAAEIQLPSGLAVGGSFKIINGKLDAIGISFEKNPGILVANGLVNIYRIEASVEGLTNLDNFKISGTVKATVGPLVKFGGESYALADVTGTINITPDYLELLGDVQLVGGKFGNGLFAGRLLWNPKPEDKNQSPRVTFDAEVKLYPGDIVRGKISAYADIKGNVDFTAQMGVFIPQAIPLAGGISLGQLNVELRVRPSEEPSASYARFGFSDISVTAFRVPTFYGSVRIGFDKLVDYNFGARFYIPLPWPFPNIDYSIDVGGRFELRDASNFPIIDILAASSVSGTPNGEILFASMTPLPDDTFIDIYADNDSLGNDGLLIASSIPYRAGTQTFVWEDMAAFASPGDPVYVYAVINDGKHAKGYSEYSPRFNVAPGFVPAVTAPMTLNFAAGEVAAFSAVLGNAIVIADPRSSHNGDSEVEVILNVGGGTVDLSHAPENVRYSGAGTSRMTLSGSAAAITSAIDGLHYSQRFATVATDTLEITVNNLPLENLGGGVKKSVLLDPNPLTLSLLPTQNADSPNTITIGSSQETPLANIDVESLQSSYITSAKVAISGYEKGQDLLSLPLDDEYFSDVDGSFDFETGVLTLSGFEWIEDYEYALQNVVFTTKSATSGKSLTVSLADDDGEKGQLTVPLNMIAGHAEPQLFLNSTGIPYLVGSGEKTVLPEGTIDIADGSNITSVTISFDEGSYVAGEDLLSYKGSFFTSVFDSVNGVLTLTGLGLEEDWSQALQQVTYASVGATFTEGNRYIHVTVTDNGVENNVANAVFVVDKALLAESHTSPSLTLSMSDLHLPANEAFAYLDSDLTLSAGSPMLLWATVAITGNYIVGEDELAVTTSWDGMTTEFDPLTGTLTISGLATVFEYEDMLRGVVFIDSAAYRTPGPAEITYSVFDGLSASEVDVLTIEIAAAPFIESDLDRVLLYDGGQTSDPVNDTFVIQHSGQINGAIVSIAGGFERGEDELVFTNRTGISGAYDASTGVLNLTGQATTEEYAAALASVRFKNSRFNPSSGERVIEYQVFDATSVSNVSQSLVIVDADVVPPQVEFAVAPSYTEDGSPVAIAPSFTLTSRDAAVTFLSAQEVLYGAEISIINYLPGEDLLTLVGDTGTIEGTFEPIEGRIFLTGEGTFDEYEAAIRNIVYSNSSDVPTLQPRQISIRLLDSGANGLNNQAITTQVIVGLPDPVTLSNGVAADIQVMQNDDSISLGLEDLVFSTPDLTLDGNELVFTAVNLPSDLLGSIVLSDGTRLQLNTPYPITKLQGLRFEPELGGAGVADFTYSVALSDSDTGNVDAGVFTDTIKITIDGIATTTSSQAFAAQMVRDIQGKNPDQTTLTSLASQLDEKLKRVGREVNGFFDESETRLSLLAEFVNSEAYRRAELSSFYDSCFQRAATTDEMSARLAELASGKTLEQIRFALIASDEYFRAQSSQGFEGYVNAIYQALLNREPTTAESNRWVKSLSSGQSRLSVVTEIGSWSNVSTSDREAIVADLLHREFEPNDTLAFDFTSRGSLIQSVIASDEYYLRSSTPTNTSRILSHVTTEYPSVGKLGDIGGDKAGGTLIAPQFVLVAAHSVVGIPPGQLTFTIGGAKHRVLDVNVHPDFDADSLGTDYGNDIAILKLDQPVVGVEPSPLSGKSPRMGEMLNLVGFGEEGGDKYGTKRVGSTPVIDEVGATTFRWTHTSEIQNDSDPGDSGSPLFMDVNGTAQVIGVVSGGTSNFDGVGDTATNTRVDKYLGWINSIVPTVQVVDAIDPPSIVFQDTELFIDENAGEQTIPFEVSADDAVVLSVESNVADMFSNVSVDFDGTSVGNVVFTSAPNKRGTAKILVTALAGATTKTETITVTIEERNDRPTLDPIPTQVTDVGTSPRTVSLSGITAGMGESGNVRLAILNSSPTGYFAASGINSTAGSSSASLNYTPASSASGRGTIILEIRDPGTDGIFNNADDAVLNQRVDVVLNNAPTLDALNNLRILPTAGEQSAALSGIGSGETPAQSLLISSVSSDTNVVSAPVVVYDPVTSLATGQVKFTPVASGTAVISVTVRDAGPDGLMGSDDDRATTRTFTVDVVDSLHPWQNSTDPLDVNNDGSVSANDVLVLINAINRDEDGELPIRSTLVPPFYDVNGNDALDPLDVLIVINSINRSSGNAEGEFSGNKMVDAIFQSLGDEGTDDSPDQWWMDTDWLGLESTGLSKAKKRAK